MSGAAAFVFLPSAVVNRPDVVGVKLCPNVWFQPEKWSRGRTERFQNQGGRSDNPEDKDLTRSPWDSESQVTIRTQGGRRWTPAAPAESPQMFGPGGVSPWTSGGSILQSAVAVSPTTRPHPSAEGCGPAPPTQGCVRFWMQNLSADQLKS